jgi:hypothetical protein
MIYATGSIDGSRRRLYQWRRLLHTVELGNHDPAARHSAESRET